jgi:hypothetical protein
MREFTVDLRELEPKAQSALHDIAKSFDLTISGGNSAELVGLRAVETGEIMAICRLRLPISGDDETQRKRVEAIVREVVPEAICQIWDYEHKYRCGLVTESGEKIEVSFVRRGVNDADVRAHARRLALLIESSNGGA